MSVADEIIALLATGSIGVYEVDLFKNRMPETPNTCGCVFDTAGVAPQAGFGVAGIQHETPGVQIRFRGEKRQSAEPYAKAQSAYRLLMANWGAVLSNTQYLTLKPLQSPFILERDGNERVVWVFNALLEKELS